MKKTFFLAVALIIIGGGLLFYFRPVFSVNGQIILRPEFEANLSAATKAQQKFQEENPNLPSGADLEIVAAQRILEMHLVHSELWKQVDPKTLDPLLQTKIKPALNNANFVSAAQSLYGLNLAGIKKYIVIPQAEEDVLSSNLLLRGKNFGDWLSGAKNSAHVKVYMSSLRWNGSGFGK